LSGYNVHAQQYWNGDEQHDEEKEKSQADIAREIRDKSNNKRTKERSRFIGKREQGEEG